MNVGFVAFSRKQEISGVTVGYDLMLNFMIMVLKESILHYISRET
jgi:hypothetical protein